MDGVHYLERTVGILVLEAFEDKIHIGCDWFSLGRVVSCGRRAGTVRFVGITQTNESIKGEGRVADPRCTVIPVPPTADEFWK